MPYTLNFHRVLKAPPARVYKAFLDPAGTAKWLPPAGYTCTVHHMDAKIGGTFKMSFTEFNSGHSHSFGGNYLEMVPGEKLVYTDVFDDPNMPGELVVTVILKKVSCGCQPQLLFDVMHNSHQLYAGRVTGAFCSGVS